MSDLVLAVGLVLALEGAVYALFPGPVQTVMRQALELPPERLRLWGLAALGLGVLLVWLVRG